MGSSAGAAFFAAPVVVYANPATTIAEYILTLLASVNLGVADPQVINGLTAANQAVNNVAMAEASVGEIGQFIETAVSNGVPQQLFDIFGTTAEQAAEYVLQMPANTLSSTAAELADPATNLYASAQTWVNTGAIFPAVGGAFILPGLGATVGIAAAAVGAGIGLGFLINRAREALQELIKNGMKAGDLSVLADLPVFDGGCVGNYLPDKRYDYMNSFVLSENGVTLFAVKPDSQYRIYIKGNPGTYAVRTYAIDTRNNRVYDNQVNLTISNTGYESARITCDAIKSGIKIYDSIEQGKQDNTPIPSPSFIGQSGNQTIGQNNQADGIRSNYNPNEQTYSPISLNDYINWANSANQNTNNGVTGQEQGNLYQTFINNYITNYEYPENPENPENPDNPTVPENPTIPEIPQNPVIPENPEDVPDIEDYPELKPTIPAYPQITPTPELTPTPEVTPTPPPWDGYTPGLERKFPFCLPWDIYSAFTLFMSDRKAPHIQGNIDLGIAGKQAIDLDFSMWDDQAGLLRLLELIGFIIALIIITKHLLK